MVLVGSNRTTFLKPHDSRSSLGTTLFRRWRCRRGTRMPSRGDRATGREREREGEWRASPDDRGSSRGAVRARFAGLGQMALNVSGALQADGTAGLGWAGWLVFSFGIHLHPTYKHCKQREAVSVWSVPRATIGPEARKPRLQSVI